MWQLNVLLALKIVSFLAATAQTIGFAGLFAFEALDPYKWQLLIGGTIAIMISEGLSYLLAKRMANGNEAP
jgi:uncharacterized membrane protein